MFSTGKVNEPLRSAAGDRGNGRWRCVSRDAEQKTTASRSLWAHVASQGRAAWSSDDLREEIG